MPAVGVADGGGGVVWTYFSCLFPIHLFLSFSGRRPDTE